MSGVYKRGSTWTYVIDTGRDGSGRRKQRSRGGFPTKAQALRARREALHQLDRSSLVEPSRQPLREYIPQWLDSIDAAVRPSTHASYRTVLNTYVLPTLGDEQLKSLSAPRLNALYGELLRCGGRRGGLSPTTVRYVHTVLKRALADAVRWGYLITNPASVATPPRINRKPLSVWSGVEAAAFLGQVRSDRNYALYALALATGMRRGELLGLRWQDVDLAASRLSVTQALVKVVRHDDLRFSEPKTARGRRSIALDSATTSALKAHRSQQSQERLAWGPAWMDCGLVFTREDGSACHPDVVSSAFDRHVRSSGLPRIRFHDLRHTYATLALGASVHPKVVSDRLGHANISITLDTYSHVVRAVDEEAATAVAALIYTTTQG